MVFVAFFDVLSLALLFAGVTAFASLGHGVMGISRTSPSTPAADVSIRVPVTVAVVVAAAIVLRVAIALVVGPVALVLDDFSGDVSRAGANGCARQRIATASVCSPANGGTRGRAEQCSLPRRFTTREGHGKGDDRAEGGALER